MCAVLRMKLCERGWFLGYSVISAQNITSRDETSVARQKLQYTHFSYLQPFDRLLTFLVLLCCDWPGMMHRYVFASAIFPLSGPVLMRRRWSSHPGCCYAARAHGESRAPETGGARHAGINGKSRLVTTTREIQPIATGRDLAASLLLSHGHGRN